MLNNIWFRSVIMMLYGLFSLLSVLCLAISIWVTPYFKTPGEVGISHQMLEFGVEAGSGYCPLLLLLQLIIGFYIAVEHFEKSVHWRFLLFVASFAVAVFWANAAFGVIGPFYNSWD